MEAQLPSPQKGHSPQFSARVFCGQMAGWNKIPFGMELGFGQGHELLDMGNQLPLKEGAQEPLSFLPVSILAKRWD